MAADLVHPRDPSVNWCKHNVRFTKSRKRCCPRCARWDHYPKSSFGHCPKVHGSTSEQQVCNAFEESNDHV